MRTLSQAGELAGKRVLVRDDFNVTIGEDGKILDDFRIRASLPTIRQLLGQKARIILSSHFGRPQGKIVDSMRLEPIWKKLEEYLGLKIKKADDCVGAEVEKLAANLQDGEILLLENLRFHPEEEENDQGFAAALARLADIYVNDAFGACHRAHASIEAIAKILPSFAGLLLEKEHKTLEKVLKEPDRPLVVVIGGAKISTKIKLIKNFLEKADDLLLGGALANTVLHAKGLAVGKSMIEEKVVGEVQKLEITNPKLHIPVDVILNESKEGDMDSRVGPVGKVGDSELILDIGPETVDFFKNVITSAKTIIWNGPMGFFEQEKFSQGTKNIAQAIASCPKCFSVVGGGETTCLLEQMGIIESFSHVSTGGGAMLALLAGDKLPGIEALK
jgi:phosphoglycerate kinase